LPASLAWRKTDIFACEPRDSLLNLLLILLPRVLRQFANLCISQATMIHSKHMKANIPVDTNAFPGEQKIESIESPEQPLNCKNTSIAGDKGCRGSPHTYSIFQNIFSNLVNLSHG
jgi:hypothetical protein